MNKEREGDGEAQLEDFFENLPAILHGGAERLNIAICIRGFLGDTEK